MRFSSFPGAGFAGLAIFVTTVASGATNANPPSRVSGAPALRPNAASPRMMPHRQTNAAATCSNNYPVAGEYFVGVRSASDVAGGQYSAVLGGQQNVACDYASGVGAGALNDIGTTSGKGAKYSFIGGGLANAIAGEASFIGAGGSVNYNYVSGTDSFIGAGDNNADLANQSFLGAGVGNTIAAPATYSVLAGGNGNTVAAYEAFVGAGKSNSAQSIEAFVGAGESNTASTGAFVGAGKLGQAEGTYSFVGAGLHNSAEGDESGIVVGYANIIGGNSQYSLIAAGQSNDIGPQLDSSPWSFIGAGQGNTINGAQSSFIGAGYGNGSLGKNSFVGAGTGNGVRGNGGFIGAGQGNTISSGVNGAIAGGDGNVVGASSGFVGAGNGNTIGSSAQYGVVGGGYKNAVSGEYGAVGGGYGNKATGADATIPGGTDNYAEGAASFAAGFHAVAAHDGSFVWSDYVPSSSPALVSDTGANQFVVRASGGVYIYSTEKSPYGGVRLPPGSGSWASLSDRNAKTDIVPLDDASILAKVAALPVSAWRYKTESGVRHVGPMAQDFYAAFGVGEDDRHITSIDEDGVALAAIKALHSENVDLHSENAVLRTRLARVAQDDARRAADLAALKRQVGALAREIASATLRRTH